MSVRFRRPVFEHAGRVRSQEDGAVDEGFGALREEREGGVCERRGEDVCCVLRGWGH